MKLRRLFVALPLLVFALPAWSAGLRLPTVHSFNGVHPVGHLALPKPRPVIIGASYQLQPTCTNPLHAFKVTLRIRNEGGPLATNMGSLQIGAVDVNSIWMANGANALLPAMAPGQTITEHQWVGSLPSYRKNLPGAHTLEIDIEEQHYGALQHPLSTYRLQVTIPRGYCQVLLRPRQPSQMGFGARRFNSGAAAAMKPKVHLVSFSIGPAKVKSGQPLRINAVVRNDGGVASQPKKLWIYCASYGYPTTPWTMFKCHVPAPLKDITGAPVWVIPLRSIPAHRQMDLSMPISEHWPAGHYGFAHRVIDGTTTIAGMTEEAKMHVVDVTP